MAMNLGSANLRYVSTSRPQLLHTNSQRSVSASEDYYSLPSENNSEEADSGDDKTTVIRRTPPLDDSANQPLPPRDATTPRPIISQQPFPGRSGAQRQDTTPPPPLQFQQVDERYPTPQKHSQPGREAEVVAYPDQARTAGPSRLPTSREQRISRKAVPRTAMRPETSPTPGVDDSPYIQFAIDQLTRDEELLGRSRDASGSPDLVPVSPMSSRGSLRREGATGIRQVHPTQTQHGPVGPIAATSPSISPLSAEETAGERRTTNLVPARPPPDNYRYPPLSFVPSSLRLPAILSFILTCLILIGLVVLSMVWTAKHDGLWDYDGVGTARYFLAEYLPQVLSVAVLIWLHIIMAAAQRILPFALLASSATKFDSTDPAAASGRKGDKGGTLDKDIGAEIVHTVPMYITSHLIPNTSMIRKDEPGLSVASIVSWLAHFTVPLAAGLYQTRLYTTPGGGLWKWTSVQPVGIILVALYSLLIGGIVAIHLRLGRKPSGLKWDPVSLADVLVLLRSATGLATPRDSMAAAAATQQAGQRTSIGYWEDPQRPGTIFHGIGAARLGGAGEELQRQQEPRSQEGIQNTSTFESWATNPNTRKGKKGRKSSTTASPQPSYLGQSSLILYAMIAAALLIAFLVVSFVHDPLLSGFLPRLPTITFAIPTAFSSFSPSNFLYSFVPALIGMLVPLLWEPIDTAVRYLAPYYALAAAGPSGVPAEHSVLLSYGADSAPLVSAIRARAHGHMVVTLSGIFAAFGWAVPILAGGVFTAQYVQSQGAVVIRADPNGLIGLTVFVVIAAVGWVVAWPIGSLLLRSSKVGNGASAGADAGNTSGTAYGRGTRQSQRRGLFSFGRRRQMRPTSATTPIMAGTGGNEPTSPLGGEERDIEKGDPDLESPLSRHPAFDPPPPIRDPALHQAPPGTPDLTPGTPASVPYERVRSNTPPGPEDGMVDLRDRHFGFLAGADVRYLAGVAQAVGPTVLASRVWREPRSRTDLVGRLVGRGRGRWNYDVIEAEEGGNVNRRSVLSRVEV